MSHKNGQECSCYRELKIRLLWGGYKSPRQLVKIIMSSSPFGIPKVYHDDSAAHFTDRPPCCSLCSNGNIYRGFSQLQVAKQQTPLAAGHQRRQSDRGLLGGFSAKYGPRQRDPEIQD